jgi:hypothetical protein
VSYTEISEQTSKFFLDFEAHEISELYKSTTNAMKKTFLEKVMNNSLATEKNSHILWNPKCISAFARARRLAQY